MNIKLAACLVVAITTFANIAYADIFMRTNSVSACPDISGQWAGQGYLSNWMLKCSYHGVGQVSNLDSAGRFTMSVSVDKSSGGVVCPKHVSISLPGSCNNGVISINTTFGSIRGNVSGNSGSASGKMTISPGVNADVKVQLRKVG